ncbi:MULTISPECIES: SAM-dependent methyltransferase [Streptomyces]|uniref:S-adenosyl-L-methionine-dependent methyltransferase n=1 Tax=Streptomyces morookaense TaxID=1970 RepID=A0A7Y7E5U6_STRMO|nr:MULTISPECIES: SAM-dependent methyltransferase [Streptomyces]MCC2278698.1 SAM-dependent methyltransferase [Streptomyces sp. ET3-23]NVK77283.1 SAM-dependent methyltransferase [Streptomyces morookaense]GHF18051.1 S-adenosyl-L-methionine-dependent methyltransferase [Streptomyces morookaense]
MDTTEETREAAVSVTGLWVAGLRALESERPDRVFADPYARDLAGTEFHNAHRLTGADEGYALSPVVLRTRFSDAVLTDAVGRGIRQVVMLGAGMDTRAYRLPLPADLALWELDRAEPLDYKRAVLERAGARAACRTVTVHADLADPWEEELLGAGLDTGLPTVWLVEGVFLYLDAATAESVAAAITRHSAPGSVLVFDAYGEGAFDAPAFAGWNAAFAERGTLLGPPQDEPDRWIARHGWRAAAYSRQDVLAGRCPWAPAEPRRVAEAFLDRSWMVRAELPAPDGSAR